EALSGFAESGSISVLDAYLRSREERLRLHAGKALSRVPQRLSLPILYSALEASRSGIRISALKSMGEIRSPEVVRAIIRLVLDTDTAVSDAAFQALIHIGFWALPEIKRSIADSTEPLKGRLELAMRKIEQDLLGQPDPFRW